jgi:hypothetical protein
VSCDRARSLDLAAFAADPSNEQFDGFRAHYPGCTECAREVAHWTRLERLLATAADGTDPHPEADALIALERDAESLATGVREALEAHLSGCRACATELRALRGFDFSALPRSTHAPAARSSQRPAPRLAPGPRIGLRAALIAAAAAAVYLVWALPTFQPGSRDPGVVAPDASELARVKPRPEPPPADSGKARALPSVEPVALPHEAAAEIVAAPEPPQHSGSSERAPEPAPASEPMRVALVFPTSAIRYAAPSAPDLLLRRLREPELVRSGATTDLRIRALAPDHTGLTIEASPTLYWILSGATGMRIELVVTEPGAERPLLDLALEGAPAGLHSVSLAEHGVELETGTTYRWYATLVPDPEDRSDEIVSGGEIRRIAAPSELERRLAADAGGMRAHLLAEAGLFYDALETLSTWVSQHPEAPEPVRDRAALLESVGLEVPPDAVGGRVLTP